MKSCPDCLFLIEDDEERCESCAAVASSPMASISFDDALVSFPATATAVLDRTREDLGSASQQCVAEAEHVTMRFRRRRSVSPVAVAAIALALGVIALAGAAATGRGPLADQFSRWNLTIGDSSVFPGAWVQATDVDGTFVVDLPAGAQDVFESLDPQHPDAGGLVGKKIVTDFGDTMLVGWTDFGLGGTGMAGRDSAQGAADLSRQFAAARVAGEPTLTRNEVLANGYAVDSVYVQTSAGPHDGDITTRMRLVVTPKRAFVLVTSGSDDDATALDAAHQRLLKSFSLDA